MQDFTESDLRTTVQLLNLIRKYQKIKGFPDTDYRLSKVLGMTPQGIAHMTQNGGIMTEETALKVAKELDLPPIYTLLCAWHERNKNEEIKESIQELYAKYMKVSVFILCFSVIINTISIFNYMI